MITLDDPNFAYQNGALYADKTRLYDIVQAAGTPCYVYSRDRIVANFRRLQAAFPGATIHYSLKANANLAIIRLLDTVGAGFDAVSAGEIYRAITAGAPPARIVFAGVGKTRQELRYALEMGIGWFNVESDQEYDRLGEIAEHTGKAARVALRVNPNVRADTHHYIATGHAAAKFGLPQTVARRLLDEADPDGAASIEGLHVHIGSQLQTVERTLEALHEVLPFFSEYPRLHTLNLGGGFPVSYTGEAVPSCEDFARPILELLQGQNLHLLLEPGRSIIADSGLLIVEVQYVKETPEGTVVVTDGGMTELIRPALYQAVHNVLPLREPQGDPRRTHVVGPVCESADVLRTEIMLPPIRQGDLLAIQHVGAYGAVMASTYNARPRSPEVLVEGDRWRLIRRRETWADLTNTERDTGDGDI